MIIGYISGSTVHLYAGGDGEVPHVVASLELDSNLDETHAVEITMALAELHSAAGKLGQRRPRGRPPLERASEPPGALEAAPVDYGNPLAMWHGASSVIAFVGKSPGATIASIKTAFPGTGTKAIASAVSRATMQKQIVRRAGHLYLIDKAPTAARTPTQRGPERQWDVSIEQILGYIREHPRCTTMELAEALLGENTSETKQVIGNRVNSANARADRGAGPHINKERTLGPKGLEIVLYTVAE